MNILTEIQTRLNAPKNQFNNFGNYKYRSSEDILEGLKPLLKEFDCDVVISDTIELIGDRYYIKSYVTLTKRMFNKETNETNYILIADSTAYAREPKDQRGMNEAQITGATSSYARKYALNGLFAIDDSKDADSNEHHKINNKQLSVKDQINNALNHPNVPKNDKDKMLAKLKTGEAKYNQENLDKIIAMYNI